MKTKVLLISDMASYSKVALATMIPVLTARRQEVFTLPTALVSNNFDYGRAVLMFTGDYVKNTLDIWAEYGFEFDGIFTGFVADDTQAALIADYCAEKSKTGVKIFTDPIMGDDGELYHGVSQETVECLRRTVSVADYIMPNLTEAAMLTNTEFKEKLTKEEAFALVDRLCGMGAKNVVITSCVVDGVHCCAGYDAGRQQHFVLPFEYIDIRMAGTGDVFSSVIIADIMAGKDFQYAVQDAMDTVRRLIVLNKDNDDLAKGMELERCLEEI